MCVSSLHLSHVTRNPRVDIYKVLDKHIDTHIDKHIDTHVDKHIDKHIDKCFSILSFDKGLQLKCVEQLNLTLDSQHLTALYSM